MGMFLKILWVLHLNKLFSLELKEKKLQVFQNKFYIVCTNHKTIMI